MSNPVFERNPVFNGRGGTATQGTTPNGYPAHPGYQPGGASQQYPSQYQGSPARPGQQSADPSDPRNLEQAYSQPSAGPLQTGRMTYDDVIMRTGVLLGLVVVAAAFTWMLVGTDPLGTPSPAGIGLTVVGAIVGLVLGLVNAFRKNPSPVLISLYAVAEGFFLGGISAIFEMQWPGIVMQAVLATAATFIAALLLYRSGAVRVTPKLTRFVLIALGGYLIFSLFNLGFILFGNSDAAFGLRSSITIMGIPLGVLIGIFAVVLATICLIMDFDAIKRGVEAGAPQRFAWAAAFGLVVTLVWLYVEFLRLLAILRGNN